MFKLSKNQLLIAIAVVAIIITGVLVSLKSGPIGGFSFLNIGGMSPATIAKNSVDYLNKSVLQQGQTAQLVSYSEESGVVKLKIKIGSNTYDSYATKDGKLLFPEAITIGAAVPAASNTPAPSVQATTNVPKVAKTMLEAYVVSSCPFGLQMQRAMSDAIKSVPSLAQYIKVRYIGAVSGNTITSMHGVEEAQENLRQICIRDEQQSKYWNYVACYMQKVAGTAANGMPYGDSKTCQTTAGIDTAKLNGCVSSPNRGLAYAKEDFDLNTKYNIQGSPTLILNGQTISETPFGGRSSDAIKNIICDSSTTAPDFCKNPLNTNQAATSFALTYAGGSGSAAANSNTNCAPVKN